MARSDKGQRRLKAWIAFCVVVTGVAVAMLLPRRGWGSVYYHFLICEVSISEAKAVKMIYVSKLAGRSAYEELGVEKKMLFNGFRVLEENCFKGSEFFDLWIDVTCEEWFKGKFQDAPSSQPYIRFRDLQGNESLVYFAGEGEAFLGSAIEKAEGVLRTAGMENYRVIGS